MGKVAWVENSTCKKHMGVFINDKLNIRQRCGKTAKKARKQRKNALQTAFQL